MLFEGQTSLDYIGSDGVEEQLKIHEYERQRMGQELHDSAGQLLVSLQLSVAHLRRVESRTDHDGLLEEIQATVRQIDQEIRSLAFLQYPVELGDRGLGSAVKALARGFSRRTGIPTSFKESGDLSGASASVSTAMLRVAQEALVNVHRHAHASHAKILLTCASDRLKLTISDDGVGMVSAGSPGKPTGIGMCGMRYRIEALGGLFLVRNLKHGTRISASVPVAA